MTWGGLKSTFQMHFVTPALAEKNMLWQQKEKYFFWKY